MKSNKLFLFATTLLLLLAVTMIALGINAGIIPPVLTGIGFILIALIFFKKY